MPYLHSIVESINDNIRATSLKGKRFQDSQFYCLAKSVLVVEPNTSKLIPVIYSDCKEIDVSVDDTYSLQVYHRCLNASYTGGTSFGDESDLVERANMIMVVHADPEKLNVNQEDLAFMMMAGFPSTRFNSGVYYNKITGVIIPGQVNHNSLQVYSGEYQSAGYPLNPKSIYFSINYVIETTAHRNCLNCFDC